LDGAHAEGLFLPETTTDVLEALKQCQSDKLNLTIAGAQTGTTGGALPFGGWLLSTQKMNKIIDFDPKKMSAVVQPGVTLEELGKLIGKEKLLYPPDPTEKTATIGGNAATNASGGRCFRFGSTRRWLKRLKIALTDGTILEIKREGTFANNDGLFKLNNFSLARPAYDSPRLKSSAGYFSLPKMDMLDLFIGSEGTLGIILEIEVELIPALNETIDLVAFFPTEAAAVDFVLAGKEQKIPGVNFYEYFDPHTLSMLAPSFPRLKEPQKTAVYLEQEILGDLDKALADWALLLEKHHASIDDCWLAATSPQRAELAKFRQAVPEHINELFKKHHQIKLATDIAVPDGKFKEMFNYYNDELREASLFYIKFGHIGDNHLHVNLLSSSPEELEKAKSIADLFVRKAVSLGGTVSAEHGIGKIKHRYLREMYGDKGIKEMVRVKKQFDPEFILNRGNIFSL